MLDFFKVSNATDGKTVCSILVEPALKRCSVMITVDRLITRTADETDASFRSVSNAEWRDISFWEGRCATLAKAYSPFWRGETAN
jgi:hypothetical protein